MRTCGRVLPEIVEYPRLPPNRFELDRSVKPKLSCELYKAISQTTARHVQPCGAFGRGPKSDSYTLSRYAGVCAYASAETGSPTRKTSSHSDPWAILGSGYAVNRPPSTIGFSLAQAP